MVTTKRQVFYSFDYVSDVFRVQQIINMGVVEGEPILSANAWEEVKKGGDSAIKRWIDDNMKYRSCVIVLVGSNTSNRPWVQYEIEKGWNDGKGVVGIYIHNLDSPKIGYSLKGSNPFDKFILKNGKITKKYYAPNLPFSYLYFDTKNLSDIIKCYEPPVYSFSDYVTVLYDPTLTTGQRAYRNINDNIVSWVEEAINIRNEYP